MIEFNDGTCFVICESTKRDIEQYISYNWGVNPKLQVTVDDNNEVFLTNKFGEKFACIGHII